MSSAEIDREMYFVPLYWKLCLSLCFKLHLNPELDNKPVCCMQGHFVLIKQTLQRKLHGSYAQTHCPPHSSKITCSSLWDYIALFPMYFAVRKEMLVQISCSWTFSHQEHTHRWVNLASRSTSETIFRVGIIYCRFASLHIVGGTKDRMTFSEKTSSCSWP